MQRYAYATPRNAAQRRATPRNAVQRRATQQRHQPEERRLPVALGDESIDESRRRENARRDRDPGAAPRVRHVDV